VPNASSPDWDRLYAVASGQSGLFTTEQAASAGYSWELVHHHVGAKRVERVQRGVYRMVHFPETARQNEALVAVWLWAAETATFSHETALALHGVSGLATDSVHITVPSAWRTRRLRAPKGVVLHPDEVGEGESTRHGAIPVVSVRRALEEVALAGMDPKELRRVTNEASKKGLVARDELDVVRRVLRPVGGLGRA